MAWLLSLFSSKILWFRFYTGLHCRSGFMIIVVLDLGVFRLIYADSYIICWYYSVYALINYFLRLRSLITLIIIVNLVRTYKNVFPD